MEKESIVLIVFWGIYFAFHSIFADLKVKSFFAKILKGKQKFYRIAYVFFSTIGLGIIGLAQLMVQSPKISIFDNLLILILGTVFLLIGTIVLLKASKTYDMNEFMGLSQIKSDKLEVYTELNIRGLNQIVRHPLYFGTIILILGFFLASPTQNNLALLILTLVYLFVGAKLEEKKLVEFYGESYRNYRKSVRMLIPYIF